MPIAAFLLGVAIYVQLIVCLSTANIQFVETLHRLPILTPFDASLFGSQQNDQIALFVLSATSMILFFRERKIAIISVACLSSAMVFSMSFISNVHVVVLLLLPSFVTSILLSMIVWKKSIIHILPHTQIQFPVTYSILGFIVIGIGVEFSSLVFRLSELLLSSSMVTIQPDYYMFYQLEDEISYSFGLLSPAILIVTSLSFLFRHQCISIFHRWKAALGYSYQHKVGDSAPADNIVTQHASMSYRDPLTVKTSRSVEKMNFGKLGHNIARIIQSHGHIILLGIAVLTSLTLILLSHFQIANHSASGVSTDEQYYIDKLSEMQLHSKNGLADLVSSAFRTNGADRPLTLLVMYLIGSINGDYSSIPRTFPLVLGPALVIAVYVLMRYIPSNANMIQVKRRAAVVALFASLSPQIVVGVYGGFNANWIALIPGIFSVLILTKAFDKRLDRRSVVNYSALLFGLLVITLLFHVYMWGHLVIISTVFLCISLGFHRRLISNFAIKFILVALAIAGSIGVDVVKSVLLGVPSGLSRDGVVAGYSFSIYNFGSRWQTISDTFQNYLGGFLVIPVMAVFALLWVFRANSQNGFDRFMLASLFTLSLPLLFGNTTVQARLLYDIPLFIPAAMAIFGITGRFAPVSKLMLVCMLLICVNYAVRSISNLDLVLPNGVSIDQPFLVS